MQAGPWAVKYTKVYVHHIQNLLDSMLSKCAVHCVPINLYKNNKQKDRKNLTPKLTVALWVVGRP